jgi:hypothetical protein
MWSEFVFAAERRAAEPTEPTEPIEPRTRLVPAQHGPASGVRGAAWLWPVAS